MTDGFFGNLRSGGSGKIVVDQRGLIVDYRAERGSNDHRPGESLTEVSRLVKVNNAVTGGYLSPSLYG